MIKVNVHEAKRHLSRYLRLVESGEVVTICRRNVPVAELRALPRTVESPRPLGLAEGLLEVPASFFDPLPDEILDAFEGG